MSSNDNVIPYNIHEIAKQAAEEQAKRDEEWERKRSELPNAVPAEYGDDALANEFSNRHEVDLRYVATSGRWYHWRINHWHPDDTLMAYDLVRLVLGHREKRGNGRQSRVHNHKRKNQKRR